MSQWHEIDDKPSEDGFYLVHFRDGKFAVVEFQSFTDEGGTSEWFDTDRQHEITHWMELPDPPIPFNLSLVLNLKRYRIKENFVPEENDKGAWVLASDVNQIFRDAMNKGRY